MNQRIPIKNKNFKLINHLGIYYGTVDENRFYVIEVHILNLLNLCNGLRTVDQIAEYIAGKVPFPIENVKRELLEILEELERGRLIEYS